MGNGITRSIITKLAAVWVAHLRIWRKSQVQTSAPHTVCPSDVFGGFLQSLCINIERLDVPFTAIHWTPLQVTVPQLLYYLTPRNLTC
jgi:hypothetical protein